MSDNPIRIGKVTPKKNPKITLLPRTPLNRKRGYVELKDGDKVWGRVTVETIGQNTDLTNADIVYMLEGAKIKVTEDGFFYE